MKIPGSWTAKFLVSSGGAAIVLIVLFFVFFGREWLGLDMAATIALTLGIVLTVGLGVGLMALVFYSSRSGRDEIAGGEHYNHRSQYRP